jgi:hypothetical protein
MYKKYHVIGLQRTGTNWLNKLIQHNFEVEPALDTFWKHLTPAGTKWQHQHRLDPWGCTVQELYLKDDIYYIATSKNWELFCDSIRRNAEDFPKTHNLVRRKDIKGTRQVYDMWMTWAAQKIGEPNFYWHDYLDWLQNWEVYFEYLEKKNNWKRKHKKFENVTHVPRSPNFDINNYIMKDQ